LLNQFTGQARCDSGAFRARRSSLTRSTSGRRERVRVVLREHDRVGERPCRDFLRIHVLEEREDASNASRVLVQLVGQSLDGLHWSFGAYLPFDRIGEGYPERTRLAASTPAYAARDRPSFRREAWGFSESATCPR
jgi:hypothetical protein